MKTTLSEIVNAIEQDDKMSIDAILRGFGFKENMAINISSEMSHLMDGLLRQAAAREYAGRLSDGMANILIRYLAGTCSTYEFCRLIGECVSITEEHHSVKDELLMALPREKDPYTATQLVSRLNKQEFIDLIWAITRGKVESVCTVFSFPIVRYVYYNRIIPRYLLFSFLAMAKSKPVLSVNDVADLVNFFDLMKELCNEHPEEDEHEDYDDDSDDPIHLEYGDEDEYDDGHDEDDDDFGDI